MSIDIDGMTDSELATLAEQIRRALEGRAAVAAARAAVVEAVEAYARAAGVTVDAAWRELAPADAAPGPEPVTAAEYVQPIGAHDAYAKGALVTFQGRVYRSLIDGNVWSPLAYPMGWREGA